MERITLSICDQARNVVCELYDSDTNPMGQATDIKVTQE